MLACKYVSDNRRHYVAEAKARDKEKAERAAAAAAAFGVSHNGSRPGGRWAGGSDDDEEVRPSAHQRPSC